MQKLCLVNLGESGQDQLLHLVPLASGHRAPGNKWDAQIHERKMLDQTQTMQCDPTVGLAISTHGHHHRQAENKLLSLKHR